ncbi:MAG: glycogen synthase GlgA [Candidatus Omnitrophica bacterium]|nr:glycogen synthase GlgA [Candidatus Omnitrophota bacterium]MCM8793355.1 glycogen synthase GlgA [Candidatus Omnitrophota bacterium]
MAKRLKVLYVSSEVEPFAKTGGLADVAGSLPVALEKLGVDVRVVMPHYKNIKVNGNRGFLGKNVIVYFVNHPEYFHRDYLYGTPEGDYPDNLERFAYFSKEIFNIAKENNFSPDIIHCNDWQTALVPVYLKTIFNEDPFFKNTKTILTIHNLAYQGIFPKEHFPLLGLDWSLFNIDGLEFYGKVNIMKGGIVFSDFITTVSPTYSKEIQTKEFGYGLEGLLTKRKENLWGILNGIDYEVWNPLKDPVIPFKYSFNTLQNKYVNKEYLQLETGLEINKDKPLLGIITRLADQKGLDILAPIIETLCKMDLQFILLGTGDKVYHELFEKIKVKYPRKTSINLKFDAELARKIYASADIFLMPSRFEPCGLGQMISLKYGTIPVVRKTGGLADTVIDYEPRSDTGNGFTFTAYESLSLLEAIKRALSVYRDKKSWMRLIKRAMEADFSWKVSAEKYLRLYYQVLATSDSLLHL